MSHRIKFVASGRGKAQCPPNPDYPNGIHVDLTKGSRPCCEVDLPYPAPECGFYDITCSLCGMRVAITSVGRPDDPVAARIPCLIDKSATVN